MASSEGVGFRPLFADHEGKVGWRRGGLQLRSMGGSGPMAVSGGVYRGGGAFPFGKLGVDPTGYGGHATHRALAAALPTKEFHENFGVCLASRNTPGRDE